MKNILNIILLLILTVTVKAQQQSVNETLKKVEKYYKNIKTFNLDLEYAMYKGYDGNKLTESYKGNIYKNDNITRLKILGSEILQFPKAQLTIIEENKTIIYKPINDNKLNNSPLDISSFLKYYNEVSSDVNNNTIIHELVLKNNQLPVPYNKILLHINKEDYSIKKQVLYLSTKVPFVDENGENSEDVGRMVITFKTSLSPIKTPKLQDYLVLESNKKIRLVKAYSSYSIIDQTSI